MPSGLIDKAFKGLRQLKKHPEELTVKMRILKLTPEFLMERLQGKNIALTANIPSDTELLDIKYDLFTKQVTAVIRSDSFEDTPEAYPIPEFNLTYSASPQQSPSSSPAPSPQPALIPKPLVPETKTAPAEKPEPEPAPQKRAAPHAMDTSMTEEEFTDEQRKLLNFSVDGDFVVVKPVRFLKGEWEDINDVVRSLGGRWVKGDIISYWEIPKP
jgi:hypothetical protein